MNKKKITILWSVIFFFGIFLFADKNVMASDGGTIYVSVERFTVGQGYLIEPEVVHFKKGDYYSDIICKLLKEKGYTYSATIHSMYGFYLEGIDNADTGILNIPQCIQNMSGNPPTNVNHKDNPNADTKGLYQFSYSEQAGWYYFINGKNPGIGMGNTKVQDGDVVRYQFTLYGLGGDLGDTTCPNALQLPNKDNITKNLALMRQALNEKKDADGERIYQKAVKIVSDLDSTQESFSQAESLVSNWVDDYNAEKIQEEAKKKAEEAKKKAAEEAAKKKAQQEAAQKAKQEALKKKYTPSKTSIKSIKKLKKNQAKLTWKKVKNATGYEVYQSMKKNSGYKKVKTITKNKTVTYKAGKLKKKKTYYFKIRTYRKAGGTTYYGNYSNVKKMKVK